MNNKRRRFNSPEELTDYIKYEDNKITYYRRCKDNPKISKIHRDEKDPNGLTLPAMFKYDPYLGGDVIKYWYQDGLLHRDEWEGPAIIGPNQVWYNKGMVHRNNGPAVIYEGGSMKVWYQHNQVHREDGPAVIAKRYIDYFLFGRKINEKLFYGAINRIKRAQLKTRVKFINKIRSKFNNRFCYDLEKVVISYILG